MPKLFSDPEAIAEDVIRDVGTNLVVGLPLGLGKANHIANALYTRAAADRSINLTFFSALTLERPRPSNPLERRFISPVIERLFGGYPDLAYADALRANALPPNVQVIEFFFLAGRWLHVPFAQQHYISANYTHASSYLLARGLNVVTQLVAKRVVDGVARYSLSCNTDTTLDILRARAEGRASFKLVGQVNSELPFMPGAGDLPGEEFSAMLDSAATDFPLFAPPAEPITRHQIRHRPAFGRPRSRRRHAADRYRAGGRRAGAGIDPSPPRQHAILFDHEALDALGRTARRSGDRTFRKGTLWRQRNGVRGVPRPDRGRHPQARGRWGRAAWRVFRRAEIVLPQLTRNDPGSDRAHPDDAGILHQ